MESLRSVQPDGRLRAGGAAWHSMLKALHVDERRYGRTRAPCLKTIFHSDVDLALDVLLTPLNVLHPVNHSNKREEPLLQPFHPNVLCSNSLFEACETFLYFYYYRALDSYSRVDTMHKSYLRPSGIAANQGMKLGPLFEVDRHII